MLIEQAGDLEFELAPFDEASQRRFMAYTGLGVVALREEGGEERGEPVAVAILRPLRPREIASFERRDSAVYAYTADPVAVGLLRRLGYMQLRHHVYAKRYRSNEEIGRELAEVKRALGQIGKQVFLLGALDRLVKKYEKIQSRRRAQLQAL